jgi:hypothetical protein
MRQDGSILILIGGLIMIATGLVGLAMVLYQMAH